MKTLLILLACLVVTYAQGPVRCETPKEWEGGISFHDHTHDYSTRSSVSYDAYGERWRSIDQVYLTENRTEFYDVLRLHREGREYIIDMKTRKCEEKPLTYPFRPFEIPTNAKSNGEGYLGGSLPGTGVLVGFWEAKLPVEPNRSPATWTGMWAVEGCVPVWDHVWHNSYNYTSIHFYDITLGIRDPNVFAIPSACRK